MPTELWDRLYEVWRNRSINTTLAVEQMLVPLAALWKDCVFLRDLQFSTEYGCKRKIIAHCNQFIIDATEMYSRITEKEENDFRKDQKSFPEKGARCLNKLLKVKVLSKVSNRMLLGANSRIHSLKCVKTVYYLI